MQFRHIFYFLPIVALAAPIAAPASAQTAPLSIAPLSIAQAAPASGSMPALAEEFVTLAAQGDFVGAWQYLHPSLRQSWSPVDMQSTWRSLQDRTGAFQQFLSYQETGDNVVLVKTQFENVTDDLVVIFDDSHQWIVGIDFPQS
jgi:Protein of unknown function (DUF3887)